jgi:hypothetical protein
MEEIYNFGLVFPGGDKEFTPLQNAKAEAKALCACVPADGSWGEGSMEFYCECVTHNSSNIHQQSSGTRIFYKDGLSYTLISIIYGRHPGGVGERKECL